jgi:putative ABC transport system permease protein
MTNRSWGYNNREALFANVPDQSAYEKLSAAMVQHPDVLSVSGSGHHIGKTHKSIVIQLPDREYKVDQLTVDAKYFETLGLSLEQGRFFTDHEGSDRQSVIVNEIMVKDMSRGLPGWENPVGQQFRIDSVQYEVVGVVEDFHSYNFTNLMRPVIFTVAEKQDYRFLSLRVRSGSEVKTYKALQESWTQLFPETPFAGGLQEDVWGFYYEQIGIYSLVWRTFAFLVVSLAILGLYGLIRLNVEGRTKEFSIRKVLGAGLTNIAATITSQYAILFAVALIIGAPLGFLTGKAMVEINPYHMPITLVSTVIAVALMVIVLVLTVSTQVVKVVKSNPVNGLKTE